MHLKKKIFAIAIVTLLTLSIFAVVAPTYAINAPTIWNSTKTASITTPQTVGTKIFVNGTGAVLFSTVNIYWDSTVSANLLTTTSANSAGYYFATITIPATTNGTHNIIVVDSSGVPNFVTIQIKPSLSAGMPPVRAMPGDVLTVTGKGFSASKAVTLLLGSATVANVSVTPVGGLTTNATGSFTAQVTIPTIIPANFGTFILNATDANGVNATTNISVDYYVTVFPTGGPSGITITIAGRIPANTAYSTAFSTQSAFTGTSDANGRFTGTFVIPALVVPTTHYPVTVTWGVTNTRSASPDFTASAAPTISYTPLSGVAGAVISISGTGFSVGANITLTMGTTIVNSTAMDARFGLTFMTGAFTGLTFTVPALAPGVYVLTVADAYGASTGTGNSFTVLPTPATTIALRGTAYYPGDIFSFNIRTTETNLGTINVTILDPTGNIWWTTNDWTLTGSQDGTYKTVIFQNQGADNYNQMRMTLPADAPLGTWNWTITYTPASTAVLKKATGLFTVVALPGMQDVLDEIAECCTNTSALLDTLKASILAGVTDSEGDLTTVINTKAGQITTKLDALGAQLQGIEDMSIIIATDVGEIKIAIADLDLGTMGVDITAIKGDVAVIKTNLGTVTTSVATLDAKVVTLSGDVATVSTTLGTLQGTVTAIDGKVATVNTSVGTIKADVSDIKAKPGADMTPVWIAVVLSLIAAIAAIFAVVTIRQKIAG